MSRAAKCRQWNVLFWNVECIIEGAERQVIVITDIGMTITGCGTPSLANELTAVIWFCLKYEPHSQKYLLGHFHIHQFRYVSNERKMEANYLLSPCSPFSSELLFLTLLHFCQFFSLLVHNLFMLLFSS